MVIGLLFFLATKVAPRVLLDSLGNMPHERQGAIPDTLSNDRRWPRLRAVFQRGFQNSSELRYQNIAEVQKDLASLEPAPTDDEEADVLQALGEVAAVLESKEAKKAQDGADMIWTAAGKFLEAFMSVVRRSTFVAGGSGPTNAHGGKQNKLNFFMVRSGQSSPQASFEHVIDIVDNSISARFRIEGAEDFTEYYLGSIVLTDELYEASERQGRSVAISLFKIMAKKLAELYKP